MLRRNFLSSGLVLASALSLADTAQGDSQGKTETADLVIDAHVHAGHGEALSAPCSTFNDPELVLRDAEEAGIDKTIIFPIENPTYQRHRQAVSQRVPGNIECDPLEVSRVIREGNTREADHRERWSGRRFAGGDLQDPTHEAVQRRGEERARRDCGAASSHLSAATIFNS
jgi:hypothetical protein